MRFSWRSALRSVMAAALVSVTSAAALGYDAFGRPQTPVENYLFRGQDSSHVMPASAEAPVSCTAATAGTMCDSGACGGGCCNNSCCGSALDYFAPGGDNCGCNTISAGGEVLFLKPFGTDGGAYDDFGYDLAFRAWASWQRPDGLGARLRLFNLSQTDTGGDILDMYTIDAEVIDTIQLGCNWTLVAGAGIRYFDFNDQAGSDTEFYGFGPVATLEMYRTINCNTQFYAIGRYSILFDQGPNPNGIDADAGTSTLELQIGIQRTRELANGALAFGRIGWEAQSYDALVDGDAETLGLIGGALSLGIYY